MHNVLLKTNHPKLELMELRVEGSGSGVLILYYFVVPED